MSPPSPATPGAPAIGEVEIRAAAPLTVSEAALVAWARDRFAAAGLDAPSVTVAFTPRPENCGGFQGRYYSATETVFVCDDEHASDLVRRTTLLHEMSHAWTHHHLGAANRAAFVELRDTPTWDSWDFAWSDRATEHAAVVMAWGLMDIPTTVEPRRRYVATGAGGGVSVADWRRPDQRRFGPIVRADRSRCRGGRPSQLNDVARSISLTSQPSQPTDGGSRAIRAPASNASGRQARLNRMARPSSSTGLRWENWKASSPVAFSIPIVANCPTSKG